MSIIIPAIVPESKQDLEDKLARLAQIPSVESVQIDAVDGRFATPACWPYSSPGMLTRLIRGGYALPHLGRLGYDADLMVESPEQAVLAWNALGATRLTLHAESTPSLPRAIARIRASLGQTAGFAPELFSLGVALNIATDIALILPHMAHIDYVQLMGIDTIGSQHQPLDRRVIAKTRMLRAAAPLIPIQIDGGVTLENAADLLAAGATRLIVGSALWRAPSLERVIAQLEALGTPRRGVNVL
jgi:ribulose-phosphate 3-epimerase